MKFLTNVKFLFLILAAGMWLTSCTDEPGTGTGGSGGGTGGGTETATTVDLLSGTGLVTSVSTVPAGSTFKVNLSARMGTDELGIIQICENGVKLDTSRISYSIEEFNGQNPVALTGTNKMDVNVVVEITAQSSVSTNTYEFKVSDSGNDIASASVEITTEADPPVLVINGSESISVMPGILNIVNITATRGTGLINEIAVYMNDQIVDIAGLEIDGVAFNGNPQPLGDGFDVGFDMSKLQIRVPEETGTYILRITIADEFGLSSSDEITLIVGTPLSSIEGVLLNAAGPAGTGGLDLDNGMSTGSGDSNAEIKDLGINGQSADINWIRKIAGVNGATIKYLRANEGGLTEGFSWSSIDSKETLAGLVDNGVGFDNGESDEVQVGDIFIVQANGKVYGLLTTAVNIKATDNSDNYVFTIVQ